VTAAESLEKCRAGFCIRGLKDHGAGEVPLDLVQDIRRLPNAFRSFARRD